MTEEAIKAPLTVEELSTGKKVTGKVTYLTVYGAMVDIGLERNALLHVSQLGRDENAIKVGDEIVAFVLKIDNEGRIALTTEKPPELPWNQIRKGDVYRGTVTRIEDYGAFIDIGAERPGMVHVSELADGYVQSPGDVVKVGDEVDVRVIKLNRKNRQIDLSMKTPAEEIAEVMNPADEIPSAMEMAFRRAQKQAQKDRRAENEAKKKERRYEEQEDIIKRTLRDHSR